MLNRGDRDAYYGDGPRTLTVRSINPKQSGHDEPSLDTHVQSRPGCYTGRRLKDS